VWLLKRYSTALLQHLHQLLILLQSVLLAANTLLGKPTTAAINTWAFTGVGLTNGQSKTITLILEGNTAATYGDACTVDGMLYQMVFVGLVVLHHLLHQIQIF
jgi:hypothetical protein